ncbi:type II toxin-antitoxin system HipA family toxin [Endozoicomonas sp. 4G]|uniref:type II toxin-antitoxin system HipA family toxin n=1 Tax=Endozoicomonas sp. 4G TaxID=2872754 RepID=UPI002078F558|nr:type II toxin-antitoxin system HipA family toxin [Endozoicomonas sp. 4G]
MADIDVYTAQTFTGRLTRSGSKHVFTYNQGANEALSLTMPMRIESYSYEDLHPVFQMNLPEGHLRETIERYTAKQYGSDDLSMLAILGQNHIGRLGYTLSGQSMPEHSDNAPDLQSLLASDDAQLFDHLLSRFALRSAVAGVQPKVLVETIASKDAFDRITFPSHSYIVKSWGNEFPELACNEFICLTLCQKAGLNVAPFYISDNGRLLITRRFDVTPEGIPLGFEDLCVLQGRTTREKYDASVESCVRTIKQFLSPELQARALADFFKLLLVNVLVRNGDAHLKNMGVLYDHLEGHQPGVIPAVTRSLAPVFDVVSTTPYIPNDTMALTLGGSKRWPKWKMLQKFARTQCGLNTSEINRILEEVELAAQATLPLVAELSEKHSGFREIGDQLSTLLTQKLNAV